MPTAVIYTRVSTDEQKENGFSLQDQEGRLRKHCSRKGYEILEHYQDDHSAKNFNRPAFLNFLADVKSKKVRPDVFLVLRMDRFTRNAHEGLNMVQNFKKWNIKLECLENDVDLKSPESLIPFMLNMVLPEVDNLRRGLNTKRGLRQAQREGRWPSKAPFGYKNNTGTKLVEVYEKEAEIVRFVFETFSKGIYSAEHVRKVAKQRGLILGKQGFLNMLKNQFYVGKIQLQKWEDEAAEIVKGLHEPIISEELFIEVQGVLTGRRKPYKGNTAKDDLVLSGIIVCPVCGKVMTGSTSKGNGGLYSYYHCQSKYKCKGERIRATVANDQFIDYLKTFQPQQEIIQLYYHILLDVFNTGEADKIAEKNKLEKEIKAVEDRIESLEMKFVDDLIDGSTYKKLKGRLDEHLQELVFKHFSVTSANKDFEKYLQNGLMLIQNVSAFYSGATTEVKRKIIGSIFPENLIYEKKSYRTTKVNEVFTLICSLDKAFKRKKPGKIAELSTVAPEAGLEPATL